MTAGVRFLNWAAADVQRVAKTYLTANRLVMNYMPRSGKADDAAAKVNANVNKPTANMPEKKDAALIAEQEAKLPKAADVPKFTLPAIEKSKLSNGLNVWVVRHGELPIVSMNLVLNSGATIEAANKSGVAALTAALINQGTKRRSAVDISNELQSIGVSLDARVGWDSTNISMQTLTKNLDRALDVYSDVIVNPSFPADELENIRRRSLVGFLQRKSNPRSVAEVVFSKIVYGEQPYSRNVFGDEKSIKAMRREGLASFYQNNYRPNAATLVVVGDVDPKTLTTKLERAFAEWKAGATTEAIKETNQAMTAQPSIYLVDKPGAPQSSVVIGQPGVERNNPDFYAVQIMNSILGVGSNRRLFMNLRQDKGYTYGAYSRFDFRRGAGPFQATAEIQSVSTKEAVAEFIKEFNGIRGAIPVMQAELEASKQALIRGFPAGFETVGQISNQLTNLITFDLPENTFNNYISRVNAVTIEDVKRAANKYLTPDKMAIIIVGDRKTVEPNLKQLGYSITLLDVEGNPVAQ